MAASTLTCCSLVALLAGGPAASEYQGPDYAKLKALLSPGQDAASCYARRYSAEHLKQHPKQKVTEMMLFGCSEGPEIDLEAGADDKLFKLTQISATLCQSMQADAEK